MFIYNVTFMVDNSIKNDFLLWMRSSALPMLVNAESPAREPRLTLVAEVPGDPEFAKQACSFAFQAEFPDMPTAKKWAEIYLMPVLGNYTEKFGAERALSFTTILENVEL